MYNKSLFTKLCLNLELPFIILLLASFLPALAQSPGALIENLKVKANRENCQINPIYQATACEVRWSETETSKSGNTVWITRKTKLKEKELIDVCDKICPSLKNDSEEWYAKSVSERFKQYGHIWQSRMLCDVELNNRVYTHCEASCKESTGIQQKTMYFIPQNICHDIRYNQDREREYAEKYQKPLSDKQYSGAK